MRIVVYCSSRENIPKKYFESAARIGQWIGEHGATLVYGGMNLGLMRTVATETHNAGGRIVGVVPVKEKAKALDINDEEVLAYDLNDRKAKLILLGDIFVVLAGGYGTLDEWISTFSFLTFAGDSNKTIIVLNQDHLFDPMIEQFNIMLEQGLLSKENLQRLKIATTTDECIKILETHLN